MLLSMMEQIIGSRRDVRLVAGCVDEGIDGYRSPSLECARNLSADLGVEFVSSYPDHYWITKNHAKIECV